MLDFVSWIPLRRSSCIANLAEIARDVLGDQHELVVSTSRVTQGQLKEVKQDVKSIHVNMEVVREGIPEILRRTGAIQNAALNLSSMFETRLGNVQSCQQNILFELQSRVEALPEMIENRVGLRIDDHIRQIVEVYQTPQLTNFQRNTEIQKSVRRILI